MHPSTTPWPNWLVFERLRKKRIIKGIAHDHSPCHPTLSERPDRMVLLTESLSLQRGKKPKKQGSATAQSIRLSCPSPQLRCICLRMGGVIGNRCLPGNGPLWARSQCTPLCINRRRGSIDCSRGSGSSRTTWAWWTAAR